MPAPAPWQAGGRSELISMSNPHKPGAQVEMTMTAVDVRWQDGRQEARVPARDLVPVAHLDEHDFFVGDLVEEIDPLADMDAEAQVRGATRAETCSRFQLRIQHVQQGRTSSRSKDRKATVFACGAGSKF